MPTTKSITANSDSSLRRRGWLIFFAFMVAVVAAVTVTAEEGSFPKQVTPTLSSATQQTLAQRAPAPPRVTPDRSRTKKGEKDPKLEMRTVTLNTKDGVDIRAFFFPSDKGKEAIPVLIVHEWQGQASPYEKLILSLRDAGCAVLVPDYRGHGGSTEYVDRRGRTKSFDLARMRRRDVENIVNFDLEKAKSFLKEENNAGNLNLNALVVIGIREGCVVASHWALQDWAWPSVGSVKQGQDVKSLVFISPSKQIKGVPIDPPLANATLLRLPILILAGNESPEADEAEQLGRRIEGAKRKMGRGTVSGLEVRMLSTSLSGPALVNQVRQTIPLITEFVTTQVPVDANPWIDRK